jgi:hypothetical protein
MLITNPDQLSSQDYMSRVDRTLTVEFWYPARIKPTDAKTTYDNLTLYISLFHCKPTVYVIPTLPKFRIAISGVLPWLYRVSADNVVLR